MPEVATSSIHAASVQDESEPKEIVVLESITANALDEACLAMLEGDDALIIVEVEAAKRV